MVFWEEWTEWLLGCLIVFLFLLVLSDLEFSVDALFAENEGFETAGRFV